MKRLGLESRMGTGVKRKDPDCPNLSWYRELVPGTGNGYSWICYLGPRNVIYVNSTVGRDDTFIDFEFGFGRVCLFFFVWGRN